MQWRGAEIDAAILAHAPTVRRMAHNLSRRLPTSVDPQDLVQAGMIGLLDAATRFDESQGIPFEAFASSRIHGAMLDELRELDWLPRSVRRHQRDIDQAVLKVEQQRGRVAREQEVADELRLTLAAYQRMVADAQAPSLVFIDGRGDGDGVFLDRNVPDPAPGPAEQFVEKRLHSAIAKQLRTLSERQLVFMRMRYDMDLSLAEIAEHFGFTESRASQIHAEIVLTLRDGLHAFGAPRVAPRPVGRHAARQKRLALVAKRTAKK